MSGSNMLTLRLPKDELARLDELAALQQQSRSQIVQQAIRELINSNNELRKQEFNRIKTRLEPAIREQNMLLSRVSVADEHRRF